MEILLDFLAVNIALFASNLLIVFGECLDFLCAINAVALLAILYLKIVYYLIISFYYTLKSI